ncbi:MAG: formate dehydrogenase accessory sulfurtransferase FdhD [Arenimonas sp.]
MSGPLLMPNALQTRKAIRIDHGQRSEFDDNVIEEVPIAMLYNGVSHAVMMATPTDLEDFALGFSLSEGIVENPEQFSFVETIQSDLGLSIEMAISQSRFDSLRDRQRHIAGTSACGLCGVESLQTALRPAPRVSPNQTISLHAISSGIQTLNECQPLNQQSGGVHAAGFIHANGILVREDVGRHNALDKLIGALAKQKLGAGFLVLSSRASYELVHKAAMAGIGTVVAISAPTSMAIQLADNCGITLICFARGEQMSVYTHAQSVT